MSRTLPQIIAHLQAVIADPSVSTTLVQTEDLEILIAAAQSPAATGRYAALADFAKWAISNGPWDGTNLDGGDIQERAVELGLIVATAYDPDIHGESDVAEKGDRWFVYSPLLSAPPPPDHTELVKAVRCVLDAEKYFREQMPNFWEGDPLTDACAQLRAALQSLTAPSSHPASSIPAQTADANDLLIEAMGVVNSAFGEYACGASKHLPKDEKKQFETNFAVRARKFMVDAAHHLKTQRDVFAPAQTEAQELAGEVHEMAGRVGAEFVPDKAKMATFNRAQTAEGDLVERLRLRGDALERMRTLARQLSDALLKVRPLGGSELFIQRGEEYYADPEYCGKLIAENNTRLHEALSEAARLRSVHAEMVKALEQASLELKEAANVLRPHFPSLAEIYDLASARTLSTAQGKP